MRTQPGTQNFFTKHEMKGIMGIDLMKIGQPWGFMLEFEVLAIYIEFRVLTEKYCVSYYLAVLFYISNRKCPTATSKMSVLSIILV